MVIGLLHHRPFGQTIVYTSAQDGAEAYDRAWKSDFGVTVIRDRAKILLPTPRVARNLSRIIKESNIKVAAFGAAAPLGLLSASMKRAKASGAMGSGSAPKAASLWRVASVVMPCAASDAILAVTGAGMPRGPNSPNHPTAE